MQKWVFVSRWQAALLQGVSNNDPLKSDCDWTLNTLINMEGSWYKVELFGWQCLYCTFILIGKLWVKCSRYCPLNYGLLSIWTRTTTPKTLAGSTSCDLPFKPISRVPEQVKEVFLFFFILKSSWGKKNWGTSYLTYFNSINISMSTTASKWFFLIFDFQPQKSE